VSAASIFDVTRNTGPSKTTAGGSEACADVLELSPQQPLHLPTLPRAWTRVDVQQVLDLGQREPIELRLFDESHALDDVGRVDAKPARAARHARDHAKALVVA
jgi:hypothetical protein